MTIPGKLEITEALDPPELEGVGLGGGGAVTMILKVTVIYYPVESKVPVTGIL